MHYTSLKGILMKKASEQVSHLIYIIIGVFLAMVFHQAAGSPYNETGVYHGFNFNLYVYVAALAAAFALWVFLVAVSWFLSGKFGSAEKAPEASASTPLKKAAGICLYIVFGAAVCAILLLIYEIYINENNLWPGTASTTFLRQEINHRYYFAVIALIAAVLFFTLSREPGRKKNIPFRFGLAGIFAAINAIATFCPNIFNDLGGGVPHIHAVLNSIVNVAHFRPYDELNCSIYGHFGLIFMPFVKVLGDDLTGIMLSITVFTFFTFLAAFYVADKMIEQDSLYFIALLAITGTTTIFTRRGQYFQINPLRLVFPMLMLATLTFSTYQTTHKRIVTAHVLEFAVGILAVIWNFETGLFCVAVCAGVRFFREGYDNKVFSLKMLSALLRAILYGAVCLVGAYFLVNVYNLLTGGGINSVKLFIYPLLSGTYDVDNLRVPLPSLRFLYFFQILLFFITALIVMERLVREESSDRKIDTLRFAISLSGLSSLIYFMNRAAYSNMSIAHIQMILLLASWGQYSLKLNKSNWKEVLKKPVGFFHAGIAALLFGGLVWMGIEGAMYIEVCYDYRADSSWDKSEYAEALEQINQRIPANTFGFGYCIPEVWYQLGWDNICFMTDWSDINDYNLNYALEEAKKHDSFVTTTENQKFKGYHVEDTITIGPYDFQYYVKNKKKS